MITTSFVAHFNRCITFLCRITKGREQIVNKTFVKLLDELCYDVELTYKKELKPEAAARIVI